MTHSRGGIAVPVYHVQPGTFALLEDSKNPQEWTLVAGRTFATIQPPS